MTYQVLARKWRPKTFADLVGQEHVVKALKNALDKGRLHHAYLLTGTRGVGKTTIARILAKSLNCENPHNGEPCGQCRSCSEIDSGRFVDLLEIDAASNTGIDNIREVLENAQYAPTAGKYKVYIIDEVHMLSKSAFNAMLKTLEEPPEHVKFILATTDPHKVPVTVLSRCLQFVLRNMTAQQVADHLAYVLTAEQVPYEPPALQLLGRAAMGSMRDALSLLDQAIAMGSGTVSEPDVRHMIGAVDKHYLYELLQGIVNQDGEAMMRTAQDMAARAVGFDNALSELALLLQKLALYRAVQGAVVQDDPEHDTLMRFSQYLGDEQIQLYYQCAVRGRQDLSLAPDEYAGFIMTLLRMLAFAPVAAKGQPMDGVIEGTQLHNPEHHARSEPVTKPAASLEIQINPPAQAEPAGGEIADTPPWEELAENKAVTASASLEPEDKQPLQEPLTTAEQQTEAPQDTYNGVNEANLAATEAFASAENANEADEKLPHTEDVGVVSAQWEEYSGEPLFEQPAVETLDGFVEQLPDEEDGAEEGGQEQPQLQMTGFPNDEDTEEPAVFADMPDLNQENWPVICKQLASQLGSAQMLTLHTAWVAFDEAQSELTVSVSPQAAGTVKNRESLEKIRQVLADAYVLPALKLQNRAWQDDAGWETPAMRRSRLQEEGKAKAQQLMEADAACRQLMEALDCREWRKGTVDLLENLDK